MPPLAMEVHNAHALNLRWDSSSSTDSAVSESPIAQTLSKPLTSSIKQSKQLFTNKSRTNKSKNLTVSFSGSVRVRKCLHVSSYTEEEKHATWYSKEEFEYIKEDITMAVYFVTIGMLEMGDTNEYCKRGLEARTMDGMETKTIHKCEGWNIVKEQQIKNLLKRTENKTKKMMLSSPLTIITKEQERISKAYKSISKKCAMIALQIAKEDEMEAARRSF